MLQMSSREKDIEEAYQTLDTKDQYLKEIKETLNKQNIQIEGMREELSKLQKSESALKQRTIEQARTLESIYRSREMKEQKKNSNEQQLYQLTVQIGSLSSENTELKQNMTEQQEIFELRLQETKDRASDEYLQLQEEIYAIKDEFETAENNSKIMIEDLKEKIEKKEEIIESLKLQIANTENDCNELSDLCEKQLLEIQRLNQIKEEAEKLNAEQKNTIEDYKANESNIQR